ncbi:MAG: GGDEF domain-containing protein [Firmicutes bacterium]|nr:GGDEF domain-containing protein [Candidatus Caballimonas caccae]
MKKNFKNILNSISEALLDKEKSDKIIGGTLYTVLSIVSVFMAVFNILTDKGLLIVVTGIFGLLCLVNLVICLTSRIGTRIASVLITIEFIAMFIYFLVWGNPEGFSAIWICMLPFVSMLFYGRTKGTIISGFMFLVLAFFLWVPYGQGILQHSEFTETFMMRFPLLYFAFYVVAFFMETLRSFALNEAKKLSNQYKEISIRDQLTQVYNRTGLFEKMHTRNSKKPYQKVGVIILDIDFFKKVNDTYGHLIGDKVLVDFANILTNNLKATVCRWGGEEFAMIYYDDNVKCADLETLLQKIRDYDFNYDEVKNLKITASMGVYETTDQDLRNFDKWVQKADSSLYKAKVTGRNKVVYF